MVFRGLGWFGSLGFTEVGLGFFGLWFYQAIQRMALAKSACCFKVSHLAA